MSSAAPDFSQTSPDPTANVPIDSDARACLDLAAWIGMLSSDDYLCSFTSLLIALLHADNGLSRWFLRVTRAAGVNLDAIYATRDFRPALLQDIRARRDRGEVPSGKPGWTTSATTIVSGASELMSQTGASGLGVRHVLGVYFFSLPSSHEGQMADWGFDRPLLASAFVRQMRDLYPSELPSWTNRYQQTFGNPPDLTGADPVPPPRISQFAADTPEGESYLNIEDDVYALSALLCSTRLTPPLSIGLFGDWGSGKSFFIRQMQQGVSWISGQARDSDQMQKDIPFYKHVVQIEFNAWNYSGGNLWASLVQHILDNLRLTRDEDEEMVEERRNSLKKAMELEQTARQAAQAKEADAQKSVDATTGKLKQLRFEHEAKVKELKEATERDVLGTVKIDQDTVIQLNELRDELGLEPVKQSAGEFLAAIDGTRSVLTRATAVFERVPKEHRRSFVLRSAAVLLGPPVAAIGVGALVHLLDPSVAGIGALAGWLSTTMVTATTWVRQRTAELNKQVAQLERLQALGRQQVEEEEQRHRAQVAQLEQQIALARSEVLAAQAAEEAASSRLQQIQAQLAATTPASVLADFVQERFQSEDYRKFLGLPAVISRDFRAISNLISQENHALNAMTSLAQEHACSAARINRIVLYIDDLDRCSEERVVQVLQAVHLLLAFPLFVVVVAVDARWMSRSLMQRFPGLLTASQTDGAAAPDDYLEKIFQIPFWLRPPGESSVKRMLEGLVGAPSTATSQNGNGDAAEPPPVEPPSAPVFKRRKHDPAARALEIQPEERDYIARLAPLVDRSPRAVKRFVNVYRLLKASLPPDEEDAFLEPGGALGAPYRTALFLLAVLNGLPVCGDTLLDALLASLSTTPTPAETLELLINGVQSRSPATSQELGRLTAWLDREHPNAWRGSDTADFRLWAPRVARFSYNPHRILA